MMQPVIDILLPLDWIVDRYVIHRRNYLKLDSRFPTKNIKPEHGLDNTVFNTITSSLRSVSPK